MLNILYKLFIKIINKPQNVVISTLMITSFN